MGRETSPLDNLMAISGSFSLKIRLDQPDLADLYRYYLLDSVKGRVFRWKLLKSLKL